MYQGRNNSQDLYPVRFDPNQAPQEFRRTISYEQTFHVPNNEGQHFVSNGGDFSFRQPEHSSMFQESNAYYSNPTQPFTTTEYQQSQVQSFCTNCGEQLIPGLQFCGKCGVKVGTRRQSKVKGKLKKPILIGISSLVAVAIVACIFIFVIPILTMTPQQHIEQGDFQAAYNSAPESEKQTVLITNLAAFMSKDLIDNLKDSDSYSLKNIYFDGDDSIVLEVSANNSYGGRVSNYYYYIYSKDDKKYKLFDSYSSLEEEKIYTYADTKDEKLEKMIDNAGKSLVIDVIKDDRNKIEKDYVESINKLFASKGLNGVELIGDVKEVYPGGSKLGTSV